MKSRTVAVASGSQIVCFGHSSAQIFQAEISRSGYFKHSLAVKTVGMKVTFCCTEMSIMIKHYK